MKAANITDKFFLDAFISSQAHSQFLQSWEWGEFQEKMGSQVIRIGIENGKGMIAAATLIKKALPLGRSYFYCPRGPIMNFEFSISNFESILNDEISKGNKIFDLLVDEIYRIAKKEKVIFFRFEPSFKIQNHGLSEAEGSKIKIIKTIDIQPSKTTILGLTKSEEELLKGMHQKTRYNIRLAEKRGVTIREGSSNDFEEFWNLMSETKERDGFRLHGKEYYWKMMEICDQGAVISERTNNNTGSPITSFNSSKTCLALEPRRTRRADHRLPEIKMFLAEYNGKIIAANIVGFFGDTVTYMHGASSNEYRNVMAPYLIQWEVIKQAKKMGYKHYDFYGIDEKKWPGVTRFKKGFGGFEKEYPGTFDMIFNGKWYNIYRFIRSIRRIY